MLMNCALYSGWEISITMGQERAPTSQDREQHGCCDRASMDGFTAGLVRWEFTPANSAYSVFML